MTDEHRRRETILRACVVAIVTAGVIVLAGFTWAAETYGVIGWSATPTRLGYCGQTYSLFDDVPRTWDQVVAKDPASKDAVVVEPTIGTLPVNAPLPSGDAPGAGYNGCGHLVALQLASGYRLYYKLGGP